MLIDNERYVIDLDYWRMVSKKQTLQANLDAAEEGKTCSERWAALEWLSEVNFSNCGKTESEHRYFAQAAYELSVRLNDKSKKQRNIPKNYLYLLEAIFENSMNWFDEHPIMNQFLTWRER